MRAYVLREETAADIAAIRDLVRRAFGQPDEAKLVDRLRADGDIVLSMVAESGTAIVGHVLFSRLKVEGDGATVRAVALAPVAVDPAWQRKGVGSALIEDAHGRLQAASETLSVVLGDPVYYGRFGYTSQRADGFESDYQGEYLQALDFGGGPQHGRLVYAPAFSAL